MAELRQLGGALARRPAGAGAVGGIDGEFLLFGVGMAVDAESAAAITRHLDVLVAAMAAYDRGRQYVNFGERGGRRPPRTRRDVRGAPQEIRRRRDPGAVRRQEVPGRPVAQAPRDPGPGRGCDGRGARRGPARWRSEHAPRPPLDRSRRHGQRPDHRARRPAALRQPAGAQRRRRAAVDRRPRAGGRDRSAHRCRDRDGGAGAVDASRRPSASSTARSTRTPAATPTSRPTRCRWRCGARRSRGSSRARRPRCAPT